MKNILTIGAVLLTLLISVSACKQGESKQEISAAPVESETPDTVSYTALAYSESFDPTLTVFLRDSSIKSASELPAFDILQIIPDQVNNEGIAEYMHEIYGDQFKLNSPFNQFSGTVELFYDKEKKKVAATFNSIKGVPDGQAIVYTVDGEILLERTYKNGDWVKSGAAPACSDWSYDISTSSLIINDLKNGDQFEGQARILQLMPSYNGVTEFDDILKPESFNGPFVVNGETFTGKLLAHRRIPDEDHYLVFELNFKNGLLHGAAKVYDEFSKLTTNETFHNGKILLPIEPVTTNNDLQTEKPILYFYPEDTIELVVKLNFEGNVTHTYPKYENEWKVTAHPDGTLFDESGQEYYALYWEGENERPFTVNEGAVVSGENTIAFLEESLETLGLNRREANEFIMYWLPRLENNAFNLIHFSTDEYEAMAQLDIQPKPETLIRVMMVFEPLELSITIPEQNLEAIGKIRKGFTVVEWGGKEVNRKRFF